MTPGQDAAKRATGADIVQSWRARVGAAAVPERDYYEQADYDLLGRQIDAAVAAAVTQAVQAEREAGIKLLCPWCRDNAPVLDPARCNHLRHLSGPCHLFRPGGTAHVACQASALRTRPSPQPCEYCGKTPTCPTCGRCYDRWCNSGCVFCVGERRPTR